MTTHPVAITQAAIRTTSAHPHPQSHRPAGTNRNNANITKPIASRTAQWAMMREVPVDCES
jgi:hypothetical protein